MATIQGTVTDGDGTGIEDATVLIRVSASPDQKTKTVTDANGDYSVSVSSDTYDVRAERISYHPDEQETVVVSDGETETVNLTLSGLQPKVIGRQSDVSIGVLGETTAGTGPPIGLKGVVDSPDGYGLYTPDAAQIEGRIDTGGTDFVVETATTATSGARNVVLGHASNAVTDGLIGATISGGGFDDGSTAAPNLVQGDYGTVSGGRNNTALDADSTIGGGAHNSAASGVGGTIAGGTSNAAKAVHATVGGGLENSATSGGEYATIGGGRRNEASADEATVGGGFVNTAPTPQSTVGGGKGNTALGVTSSAS